MNRRARLVVLISGFGSNLQALLDASAAGELPADIVGVVSNKHGAYGLERARQAGVLGLALPPARGQARRDYDAALAETVATLAPDWVILAGWMRVLTSTFLDRFRNRVVNLHPALPGMFPGVEAIERAYAAFLRGEIGCTGVMVHLVPDEGVDSGPVLAQVTVPMEATDSLEDLQSRVHAAEHKLLVATVARLVQLDEGESIHE
jgi:formyltetrahydrofolate-dependent phosphoribosylglycinamide formyltransferase